MRAWMSKLFLHGSPDHEELYQMARKEKIAVILAAHGEAESSRFMENYRVTRHTLAHASKVMPIPGLLQKAISVSSSLKKVLRSGSDAQGSPHNRITREQVEALQHGLNLSPLSGIYDFEVHAAFSVSPPYVEHILEETRSSAGQVVVSMAPVDNTLSCGQLCAYLASSRTPSELGTIKVLSRFWSDERLYALYCDHLFESNGDSRPAQQSPAVDGERILILLFHGTLVKDLKGKPPLFRTGEAESRIFAERLQKVILNDCRNPYQRVMVAYLNHNVGGEWTKPSFEEVCTSLSRDSALCVDLFGCGYFADGNETIHRAEEVGRNSSVRQATSFPCINTAPGFTAWLTLKVTDAARQIMSLR